MTPGSLHSTFGPDPVIGSVRRTSPPGRYVSAVMFVVLEWGKGPDFLDTNVLINHSEQNRWNRVE